MTSMPSSAMSSSSTMMNGNNNNHVTTNGSSGVYSNGQQEQQTYNYRYPNTTNTTNTSNSNNNSPLLSDGWLELFLTPYEKFQFSQWNEMMNETLYNTSYIHRILQPIFRYIAIHYIPDNVSPNLITLTGLIMLMQGWYIIYTYGIISPYLCTWLGVLQIFCFFLTSNITCYHSDRIQQHTSLNDLFKYCCDTISTVFYTIITIYCCFDLQNNEYENIQIQWYFVQIGQLVLYLKHLSAYHRNSSLRYRLGTGPDEVLLFSIFLLICKATIGYHTIFTIYYYYFGGQYIHYIFHQFITSSQQQTTTTTTSTIINSLTTDIQQPSGEDIVKVIYYIIFIIAIIKSLLLSNKKHNFTKFGLITSLLMRFIPALLLSSSTTSIINQTTVMDVICDGLFMAVLTSDIALAKMSNRQIHPWIILSSFGAVLSYGFISILVVTYYIAIFSDLCSYLNMPLLTTCRNVYCDGIYDLCHIGHKIAFQNALSYGNRLYVGVVNDLDASQYKRPPIMSSNERCAEVLSCKAVTKVIPNAPCFGLTIEFIQYHQIHIVAFGEEYLLKYPNPLDDPYYKIPRLLGIARTLPRTNTLSTTELIERILSRSTNNDNDDTNGNHAILQKRSPT